MVLSVFFTYCVYILQVILSWHHQDKDVVVVAMLWQDSTFIKNVPVAGTKSWVTTLVFKEKSVLFVKI